jgi:hypothetical protein
VNSQDQRWAKLEREETMAKEIVDVLSGNPLQAKCDVRKRVDGWRVAFRGLSEAEARQVVEIVAAKRS